MRNSEVGSISSSSISQGSLFDDIETGKNTEKSDANSEPRDLFEKKEIEKVNVEGQIAGRVPASNGAMGLINGFDSNIGAGVRIGIFRGLKEIGLGFVESLYENSGGDFELPEGAALALKYEEKTYDMGNRYVKEDPVRKACDEAFRRDGRDVIWVETKGVAEIGGGDGGTIPLGQLADADANLNVSGLLRYRRFEPFESASGTLLAGQAFANTVNVPITATLARRMPAGGEFEFTTESSVALNPEIAKPYGFKNEAGNLGASASIGGKHARKTESTVSVQRLPFGEEVLVKISKKYSDASSLSAGLRAGLELKKDAVERLPEIGKGFLKYLLDRLQLPDAPKSVKKYLQSRLQIKGRKEKQNLEMTRYVFDLSKPSARKAYEEIFTKFSLSHTNELIAKSDDGVRAQHASEKVGIREKGVAAILGPTKIFLLSALEAEREGKVSADGRNDIIYRDAKFEKTYVNWFHGEQKIKWEAVTVERANEKEKQNYVHLLFTNSDRMTTEEEITQLLRFANGIGIQTNSIDKNSQVKPELIAKVLADRDDTNTRIDMYFTDAGIKNIANARKSEAVKAYIQADFDLNPQKNGVDNRILNRFSEISNMWFFKRIFFWGEMSRLREEYRTVTQGRSVDHDARIELEAQNFAESIGRMGAAEDSLKQYFIKLGKLNGFQFMRSVAALTKIASIKETILHELSITGGGLTLAAIDEGEILHPEKAMHRMLTKIA